MAARWVTVQKAAPVLDMTEDQIYRAIREQKFPFRFIKIGKLIRISAADIGLIEQDEQQESAEAQAEAIAA